MADERERLQRAGEILLKKQQERLAKGEAAPEQPSLLDALLPAVWKPEQIKPAAKSAIRIPAGPVMTDAVLIRPEDILYVHSIFLQCFMPVRHNAKNAQRWETGNRDAKLLIKAGELINPNDPGKFRQCLVPAGPKARIVTAYIHDYAFRHKTPEIDLGESMREFMAQAGIPIGGKNGKELQREMENVAAADIYFGWWNPGVSAGQRKAPVSEEFSFWIDKDPRQATLWQPKMLLSKKYFDAILEGQHLAPIYWPALKALQHSARAMDIFTFLSYRLWTIPLNRPLPLKIDILHGMFGRDIKQRKHFWPRFLRALEDAARHYPNARYQVMNDCVMFWHSPPIIPHKKSVQIT